MSAPADIKSTKADVIHKGGQRQRIDPEAFGERMREAMAVKGVKNSELAEDAGISRQLISEYVSGKKIAGADYLFAIADSLGVQARWLLRGEGERDRSLYAEPPSARLPIFDLFRFTEVGKPEPTEWVSIPEAIMQTLRVQSGLWLAEMPSSAMPSLAQEGELLVCRDPEPMLQDRRIYVLLIDGRPIVRRVFVRPDGIQLRSEDERDTLLVTLPDVEALTPIARVVSAIAVHSA